MKKKAQIQLTFHWIYILIAGAIILLFFTGIVLKQKDISEEKLNQEVTRIMESILIGAGVSEKTKQFINIKGLSDYVFEFNCQDGYGSFGIKGRDSIEMPTEAIFSPQEMKTTGMIFWSLPYELPYKVSDLLMVSSINTKYFVVGGENTPFRLELENSISSSPEDEAKFNFEFINQDQYNEITSGGNYQIRIIYLQSINQLNKGNIPTNLNEMDPTKLTAVEINGNTITYFQKQKNNPTWIMLNQPLNLISIAPEKDSTKYAAIFSQTPQNYQCNLMKALHRMKYITQIYGEKLTEIITYYQTNPSATHHDSCLLLLKNQVQFSFGQLQTAVNLCSDSNSYQDCQSIPAHAIALKSANQVLQDEGCAQLY